MTTIKTPTPEEINEAAEKRSIDILWSLKDNEDKYDALDLQEKYEQGFKDAISWLQNYQTQQQGEIKSAED